MGGASAGWICAGDRKEINRKQTATAFFDMHVKSKQTATYLSQFTMHTTLNNLIEKIWLSQTLTYTFLYFSFCSVRLWCKANGCKMGVGLWEDGRWVFVSFISLFSWSMMVVLRCSFPILFLCSMGLPNPKNRSHIHPYPAITHPRVYPLRTWFSINFFPVICVCACAVHHCSTFQSCSFYIYSAFLFDLSLISDLANSFDGISTI